MAVINICLVAILGIINVQHSHAQLNDLTDNNLITDFLNNFPEATVDQGDENVFNTTNINYSFPATGFVMSFKDHLQLVNVTSKIEIAGKSFIGGSMEITVRTNTTEARLSTPNNRTITGRIGKIGVSQRLDFNAINVIANVSLEPTGYILDNMNILFVPVDDDLPYHINANERALGDRIKDWLSNKVPVVVDKYKAYIDQLTKDGVLILNDSLL